MTLVKGLVEDLFEDIADVTLIDEDTKPILTDDANKEIPINMTMWRHLVAKFPTNACDAIWWPNFVLMQEFPKNSCGATC